MRPLPLGLACLLVLACSPARPAEPDVDRIRRDWQARYEATTDFVYRMKGKVVFLPGSLIRPGDPTAPKSVQDTGYPRAELGQATDRAWLVDLKNGKFRQDAVVIHFRDEKLDVSAWQVVEAFDGGRIWTSNRDKRWSKPRVQDRAGQHFTTSDMPVLSAHGLFPMDPKTPDGILAATVDRFDLTPIGTEVVDGRTCEVIEIRPKGAAGNQRHEPRLFVDPERRSAVVRIETFQNGNFFGGPNPTLGRRTDISYQEHEGRWLPHRWVTQHFTHAVGAQGSFSIPDGSSEYVVEEVRINTGIDAARFVPAVELLAPAESARRDPIEAPRP